MSLWSKTINRLGRRRQEPHRDTQIYPRLMQVLGGQNISKKQPVYNPTPWNLRSFARTPYARRAINAIKGPISQLDWEVVPKDGVEMNSELQRQCEIVTRCLRSPNHEDSWRSRVERVVEDILSGAGAIEQQLSGDKERPLWLYPVDGLSIQLYPAWSGDPREAKYSQVPGYGMLSGASHGIDLRNDELIYIIPIPTTSHPFGTGRREFDRLLRIYPQFGDPQIDLKAQVGVIYYGIIRPLAMRYGVLEQRRIVFCGAPPILLPMAKPDATGDVSAAITGVTAGLPQSRCLIIADDMTVIAVKVLG